MSSSVPRYSNAKHWCALCKTFIQNDPKSIRMHEEGLRHLGVVKRRLNQAARAKDDQVGKFRGSSSSTAMIAAAPKVVVEETKEELNLRADEVFGQYSIRGQVYLQGEYHEDLLLLPSCTCQLSLVDEEGEPGSWVPCRVDSFDPVNQAYVVEFQQEAEEGSPATVETVHVLATDLRVLGPAPPAEISEWELTNIGEEAASDNEEEDESLQKQDRPKIEYYKGVAIVDDDGQAQLLPAKVEEQPGSSSTEPAAPVMFRKRARPGAKE